MYCWLNHKGPGHPTKRTTVEDLLKYAGSTDPLVFTDLRAKDYVDAMSIMLGEQVSTMMWDDAQVDENLLVTYVTIPHLS